MQCARCTNPMPADRLRYTNARFCSDQCRRDFYDADYRAKAPTTGMSTATVGAVHELWVSIDLLERGYEVFRAISPSCSCDLAILLNDKLLRIEVTTGRRYPSGNVSHPNKDTDRFDLLAVVLINPEGQREILYDPPLASSVAVSTTISPPEGKAATG